MAHGLRAVFGERGVEVSSDRADAPWRWQPTAARWGCAGDLSAVEAVAPEASENRATYRQPGFDEWYVVGPLGVEHGFTVPASPTCRARGGDGVVIELAKRGGLEAKALPDGKTASLLDRSGAEVLRYSDLYVVDAAGKGLPAELRAREGALAIWFDDRDATYPVTVDPLIAVQPALAAEDGCSCRAAGTSNRQGGAGALGLGVVALTMAARRRRSSRAA